MGDYNIVARRGSNPPPENSAHSPQPNALPVERKETIRQMGLLGRVDPVKGEPVPTRQLSMVQEDKQPSGFAMCQFDDGSFVITTFRVEFGRDVRAVHEAKIKAQRNREAAMWTQTAGSVISEGAGIMGLDRTPEEDEEPSFVLPDLLGSESSAAVDPRDLEISRPLPNYDYSNAADQQARMQRSDQTSLQSELTDPSHPDPNRTILVPIHTASTEPHKVIYDQKKISQRHIKIYWSHAEAKWKLQVLGRNGAFFLYPGQEPDEEHLPPWKQAVVKDSAADLGGSPEDRVARLEKAKVNELEGTEEAFTRSMTGETSKTKDGTEYVWEYTGPYDLHHGQIIQVQGVQMTFKLPSAGREQSSSDYSDSDEDELVNGEQQRLHRSTTSTSVEGLTSKVPRGSAKSHGEPGPATTAAAIVPNGPPQIPKRRGPGRPPKDGISSTRQKREEAKMRKEAEARAANGGVTPPPSTTRSKPTKAQSRPSETLTEPTSAKRKYTKRRRPEDDVVQSIEAADEAADDEEEAEAGGEDSRTTKRSKRQRSPSPQPRPRHEYTEAELAEPTDNYAVMLHKILMEHGKELPLRKIYHAVELRYPIFFFKDTKGWQSSVRHNLNGSSSKGEPNGFIKGAKDGKGFFWRADPNWSYPKENERRRQTHQSQTNKAQNNITGMRSQPMQGYPGGHWAAHPGNTIPPNGQPPVFYGPGANAHAQQPHPGWLQNGPTHHPASMVGQIPSNGPNIPQHGPVSQVQLSQNLNSMHLTQNQPPSEGSPAPGLMLQPQGSQRQFLPSRPESSQSVAKHHSPQTSRPPSAQASATQGQNWPSSKQSTSQDSLLPANMPCTLEGRARINTFEKLMLQDTAAADFIRIVFQSVRGRELHGKAGLSIPVDLVPAGVVLQEVEETITQGIRNIIKAHSNPRFKGFLKRPGVNADEAAVMDNGNPEAQGENEGDDKDVDMAEGDKAEKSVQEDEEEKDAEAERQQSGFHFNLKREKQE